jgi:hypothetical protein
MPHCDVTCPFSCKVLDTETAPPFLASDKFFSDLASSADNVLKYVLSGNEIERETNDRTNVFIAECHVFIQGIQSLPRGVSLGSNCQLITGQYFVTNIMCLAVVVRSYRFYLEFQSAT